LPPRRIAAPALAALALVGGAAVAQDDPVAWSQATVRGMLEICRQDSPDAARVAEHAEVWGWPPFKGYVEHPEGFKREAGGESRRDFQAGDKTAFVEATVQSGTVVSAGPAQIRYFRCDIDSDQEIDAGLVSYFTGLYGPPSTKPNGTFVWLSGAANGAAGEQAVLDAMKTSAAPAEGAIIELGHEDDRDEVRITNFSSAPQG
jgi:hypothetical protein